MASNNTLSGIRDAVNASNAGVTASLVVDGAQTRLLFTADDSGAGNAISISTDDDDLNDTDASGLSHLHTTLIQVRLLYRISVSEARSPQDASFTLNGLRLQILQIILRGWSTGWTSP